MIEIKSRRVYYHLIGLWVLALCLLPAVVSAMMTELPADLIKKDPKEQQAWLNREFETAHKEQLIVGRQRFDSRMEEKDLVIKEMNVTALSRVELIKRQRTNSAPKTNNPPVDLMSMLQLLALVILMTALLVRFYRRIKTSQKHMPESQAIAKAMANHTGEYAQRVGQSQPKQRAGAYVNRFNYNDPKS